jgi:hypothetical protein
MKKLVHSPIFMQHFSFNPLALMHTPSNCYCSIKLMRSAHNVAPVTYSHIERGLSAKIKLTANDILRMRKSR